MYSQNQPDSVYLHSLGIQQDLSRMDIYGVMERSQMQYDSTSQFPQSSPLNNSFEPMEATLPQLYQMNQVLPQNESNGYFACSTCGAVFDILQHLIMHTSSHSRTDKSTSRYHSVHTCHLCKKSFGRRDILIRHQRTHTGQKPFNCSVCGQAFSRSDHLRSHQKLHTEDKPYKCSLCPYASSSSDTFARHLWSHQTVDGIQNPASNAQLNIHDNLHASTLQPLENNRSIGGYNERTDYSLNSIGNIMNMPSPFFPSYEECFMPYSSCLSAPPSLVSYQSNPNSSMSFGQESCFESILFRPEITEIINDFSL